MKLVGISCVLILLAQCLWGQNPKDMPLRQVISQAQGMIAKGDFAGASPYLDELEVRFEDEKLPVQAPGQQGSVPAVVQTVLFG